MARSTPKFREALAILARHSVDFIVVGGVAAVLNGAPISTFDLDLVHRRTPENVGRLMLALAELGALYRDPADRRLPPVAANLVGPGHNLLITKCGPVDLLGTIGKGDTFETLIGNTVAQQLGSFTIRVLDLAALIRVKEETARDKDLAVLAILRRTLQEKTR